MNLALHDHAENQSEMRSWFLMINTAIVLNVGSTPVQIK